MTNTYKEIEARIETLETELENYYKASAAVGGFFDEIAEREQLLREERALLFEAVQPDGTSDIPIGLVSGLVDKMDQELTDAQAHHKHTREIPESHIMKRAIAKFEDRKSRMSRYYYDWSVSGHAENANHCRIIMNTLDSFIIHYNRDLYHLPFGGWPSKLLSLRIYSWDKQLELLTALQKQATLEYVLDECRLLTTEISKMREQAKRWIEQRKEEGK